MTDINQLSTSIDETSPISLLLKGDPGSGKTYKAAHFPNPVIFNFDNNLSCIKNLPKEQKDKVKIIDPHRSVKDQTRQAKPKTWDNFVKQLEVVVNTPGQLTVVIDSVTTLADCLFDKILQTDDPGKPIEIQHYGDFNRYMRWLGEDVLCASDRDKVFIFLAHEAEDNSGVKTLNIPTRIKGSFDLYFTDCWRTFVKVPTSGDPKYMVRTVPGYNFRCKRSGDIPNEFNWDEKGQEIINKLISNG